MSTYATLRGTILDDVTSAPFAGLRVVLGRVRLNRFSAIQDVTTNDQGGFFFDLENASGAMAYEIRAFQSGRRVAISDGESQFRGEPLPELITLKVTAYAGETYVQSPPPIPSGATYSVRGIIRHADGSPLAGAEVRAYYRRLDGFRQLKVDGQLVTASTGAYGEYALRYDDTPERLVVKVFGGTVELGVSAMLRSPADHQRVDLVVTHNGARGMSEYGRMFANAASHMDGLAYSAVDSKGIDVFAEASGFNPLHLRMFVRAQQLATSLPVGPEVVYALLRQGCGNHEDIVTMLSKARIEALLQESADANYTSDDTATNATAYADALRGHRVTRALQDLGPTPLKALLDTTTTVALEQQAFAQLLIDHRGAKEGLWTAVQADTTIAASANTNLASDLRRMFDLAEITGNHAKLVQALNEKYPGITAKAVAALTTADWITLFTYALAGGGTPGVLAAIGGVDAAERQANYLLALERIGEHRFPHAVVRQRLMDDAGAGAAIKAFLASNPDHQFTTKITSAMWGADTTLRDELRRYQRSYRVGSKQRKHDVIAAMRANNITSAWEVMRLGWTDFKNAVTSGASAISSDSAKEAFDRAQGIAASNTTVLMNLLPTASDIRLVPTDLTPAQTSSDADFTNIFGSIDFCACEHCRSLLGPAAYLVDLLEWVKTKGHLDTLSARRPDIKHLLLTCENTNKAIPHIDIALEVLENAVAPNGINAFDTGATSPEALLSNPQNVNIAAYDLLKDARHPFSAPFHFYNAQAEVFMGQVGLERVALMTAYQTTTVPTDLQISATRLGLSQTGLNNLVAGGGSNEELWGFTSTNATDWHTLLAADTSLVRARASLTRKEMVAVMGAKFWNPTGAFSLLPATECDPDATTIGGAPAKADFLRLMQFIRAWRLFGWSWLTTDKVLANFANIDTTAVATLSDVNDLEADTGVEILKVMALWSDVETRVDPDDVETPLYDQLFMRDDVSAQGLGVTSPFALNGARTEVASVTPGPADLLANHTAALLAAFGTDESQLTAAISDAATNGDLTLSNLSAVYRRIVLAQGLGLTVQQLLALRDLEPGTFDAFANPPTTLTFAQRVRRLQALPVSIDELLYAARIDSPTASDVAPTDLWIQSTLGGLRDTLAPLLDIAQVPDDEGLQLRARLVELVGEGSMGTIMTHLATGGDIQDGTAGPPTPGVLAVLDGYLDPTVRTTLYATPQDPLLRNEILLYGIELGLAKIAARAQVVQTFGDALGIHTDVLELLRGKTLSYFGTQTDFTDTFVASAFVAGTPGEWDVIVRSDATYTQAFEVVELLQKMSHLVNAFGADPDETAQWFASLEATPSAKLGLLDLRNAHTSTVRDTDQWLATASWFAFGDRMPGESPTFPELWADLLGATTLLSDFLTPLAARTNWSAADLNQLATDFGLNVASPSAAVLDRMAECAQMADGAGVSIPTLTGWAGADLDSATADAIVSAARAKHDDEDRWFTASRPIRDALRARQQPPLVDYVIANDSRLTDGDDLNDHFLLDMQTAPCSLTSRVKSAISSVQLFVQRGFLGLEPAVTFADGHREEWTIKKQYRLWEAARKVFFYPENWIEPELRDNKSPFFEELETALAGDDVDDKLVEGALISYLESVQATSSLDVMTTITEYVDFEEVTVSMPAIGGVSIDPQLATDPPPGPSWSPGSDLTVSVPTGAVTHLFGRTVGTPHKYFYRRRLVNRSWTPWEPMDVDIQGSSLVASIVDGRLRVFWPTSHEVPASVEGDPSTSSVTLHMSEYQEGNWTPAVLSEVPVSDAPFGNDYQIRFDVAAQSKDEIQVRGAFGSTSARGTFGFKHGGFIYRVGTNEILPDANFPYTTTNPLPAGISPPPHMDIWFQQYRANVATDLQLQVGAGTATLLATSSSDYRISLSNINWTEPFVVRSQERSFFVTSKANNSMGVDTYLFENLSHPYTGELISALRVDGLDALYRADPGTAYDRQQKVESTFGDYDPQTAVLAPYPTDAFHFDHNEAAAIYNWEIFFHGPFAVANRLSQNQRFEEAMRWYHVIFDPTNRETLYTEEQRPWKVKPLLEPTAADVTKWAAFTGVDATTPAAIDTQRLFAEQVAQWRESPFSPHLIARLRPGTYQRAVVMKYLDNLIAFGDSLFRRDTIEALNEAMQLYLFASAILGERPEVMPNPTEVTPQSYDQLKTTLDSLNNAVVGMENVLLEPAPVVSGTPVPIDIAPVFYFCVPPNEEVLKYWDTVEDRLFKLRNCLSLSGEFRVLALFAPPIDPGALVKAAANGVSLGTLLSELDTRLPNHRFNVMLARANQVSGSVRALGSALLQALEKKDGEDLSVLRSAQELSLQEQVRLVRQLQLENARSGLQAAESSLAEAEARRLHYEGLIDKGQLTSEKEQQKRLRKALAFDLRAQAANATAAVLALVLDIEGPATPKVKFGGTHLGASASAGAAVLGIGGIIHRFNAQKAGVKASNQRRKQDWKFQLGQAERQLKTLETQIEIASLAVDLATKELENHDLQMANSQATDAYMRSKYTNKELYSWMTTEISKIYFQTYQLAYDYARKAQACYRHELGISDASFVASGHWDSLKKGLLSGERLQQQLEAMEASYLENDRREYEITKQVSLDLLDSYALAELRETGECYFTLAQALFDLDFPSHYMRRLKGVSITIPGMSGSLDGVNAKLTLQKSSTRWAAADAVGADDSPIMESIVVSGAVNDSGLFQFDFNDPKYLPFERRGAVSTWRLKLTSVTPQLDRQELRDVLVTLRYTAREGGETNARSYSDVMAALNVYPGGDSAAPDDLTRVFSASRTFEDAWHRMLNPTDPNATAPSLVIPLSTAFFPYAHRTAALEVTHVELLLAGPGVPATAGALVGTLALGGATGVAVSIDGNTTVLGLASADVTVTGAPANLTLTLTSGDSALIAGSPLRMVSTGIDDLLFVVHYKVVA